jgi:RNA polymerase sigma factor (sigma-70 family)
MAYATLVTETDATPDELLDRYRAGDTRVLRILMVRYNRAMTIVANRYVKTRQDIDDAVQDAWVAFTRAQQSITQADRLGGWLCVTTSRTALAIARRNNRVDPVADVEAMCTVVIDHDEDNGDEDQLRQRLVRNAVARLTAVEQQMATLIVQGNLSYSAIAALVGMPVGSIGPTRQRIIAKLRRDPAIFRLLAEQSV